MGFVSLLLLCRAFLSSRACCHLVCPLFEGAAKLLPLSAPVTGRPFPPISVDVKHLHVLLANIFEVKEGSSQSFARRQLAVQKVLGDLPVYYTVDVPEPVELTLHEQSEYAWDPDASEDLGVWDLVTPFDAQDTSRAVHMECVESFFLPRVQGPRRTATQKCAEDTGSVCNHLGVGSQFAVLPYSFHQSSSGQATNPPVDRKRGCL